MAIFISIYLSALIVEWGVRVNVLFIG